MEITNQESPWHGMRVAPQRGADEWTICSLLTDWVNAETPWRATYNDEWDVVIMDSPYRPVAKYPMDFDDIILSDYEYADPRFFEQLKAKLLEYWHIHHRIRRS